MERQIVRGTKQAFVLFVRGRTTSAGGAGEQATNKGFVGFFFRHVLPFGQEFCPRLMCSTCAAASLIAFSLAKNLKREKKALKGFNMSFCCHAHHAQLLFSCA
jgi:hypothetical protein